MEKRGRRSIVMWLRKTDDHSRENFFNGEKRLAYHLFFEKISKRNNFRFSFGEDAYLGDGCFSNIAVYQDERAVETGENFKADIIYNFSKLAGPDFNAGKAVVVNSAAFREFCVKINAYSYLQEFFPKTYLAYSFKEVNKYLEKIETNKVVLKPNKGKAGKDVFIFDIDKVDLSLLPSTILRDEGFLVQEFIDTSCGIKDIASSYHDFRIVTHGEKISMCHVRQPRPGSLISNSHQGASVTEVNLDSIPDSILNFYHQVHSRIRQKYPCSMYSMDIGMTTKGPLLIELNAQPSFPKENFKCLDSYICNLIEYLETVN